MSATDLESPARACELFRGAPQQRLRRRAHGALLLCAVVLAAAPPGMSCSNDADPEAAALDAPPAPRTPDRQRRSAQEIREDWGYRLEKKRDWWNHAREVLFADIELSDEQQRAVDAVIEEQLATRERLQQSDAEVQAARAARAPERVEAARANSVEIRAQLKDLREIYEELRALLRDEQRPIFDMNRARHIAENRAPAPRLPQQGDATSPTTTASR